MSAVQRLNDVISLTLKNAVSTFVFYPVGRERITDIRVELSHDTARILLAACADFAAQEGMAFESLSDLKALEDRCIVVARITFFDKTHGFSWTCEALGEAPYRAGTPYIDPKTGEERYHVNDAAVRTAEARATKRAVEKLAPTAVQRWIEWARRAAMASLDVIWPKCREHYNKPSFFLEFNNACRSLCVSKLNAEIAKRNTTGTHQPQAQAKQ